MLEDVDIKAMKTGMLFDSASIRAVVRTLKSHYGSQDLPPLVCDPVCVSTSGHTLLHEDAVDVMISDLFPLTALVTPNKAEAELILSGKGTPVAIRNLEDMFSAAKEILKLGPKAILLKGGHLTVAPQDVQAFHLQHPEVLVVRDMMFEDNMEILQVHEHVSSLSEIVVDVLRDASSTTLFLRPRIDSSSTHGTGCTLSAALVCALSRGETREFLLCVLFCSATQPYRLLVVEATRQATKYTHLGIETAHPIGKGFGPLNHMHALTARIVPQYVIDH